MLAAASLPAVASASGWRAASAVGGLVALLGAAAFVVAYRQPPRPMAPGPRQTPGCEAPGRRLAALQVPALRRAMLTGAVLVCVHSGLGLLTVLHLHEAAGMSPGHAATVFVAAQAAGAAGRIGLAAWSDRPHIRRGYVVTVSLVAVLASLIVLVTPLGRSALAASAVFVWLGFFGIGWLGPWVALVAEAAPGGRTGFALGLVMTVNQVAIVLAPPVLGLLRDTTGSFTASWALLAMLACLALAPGARTAVTLTWRSLRRSERSPG